MGFLLFQSPLPQAEYYSRIDSPTPDQAIALLNHARAIALHKMFEYAPLDLQGVKKLALQHQAKNISGLVAVLESIKPAQLENMLRPLVTLKPLSEEEALTKKQGDGIILAYPAFFYYACQKIFSPALPVLSAESKPSKLSDSQLLLAADYGDWRVVKKTDFSKAEPKEVLATLSSVYEIATQKLVEYAAPAYADFAQGFLAQYPERRNYTRLLEILRAAQAKENELKSFSQNPVIQALLPQIFFSQAMKQAGYPPFVTREQVSEVYPDIKTPKPRGNYGGGKKKKK